MGGKEPPWQDAEEVLGVFSSTRARARQLYESFLQDGVKEKPRHDLMGGGLRRSAGGWIDRKARQAYDSQVLGSGSFVEEVLRRVEKDDAQASRWRNETPQGLAKRIGERMGVDPDRLFERGRSEAVSKAKAMLIFAGVRKLGEAQKRMADLVRVTPGAATRALSRGQALWNEMGLETKP